MIPGWGTCLKWRKRRAISNEASIILNAFAALSVSERLGIRFVFIIGSKTGGKNATWPIKTKVFPQILYVPRLTFPMT